MLDLKTAALLTCLAMIGFIGWKAHEWRTQAGRVPTLQAALSDETKRRISAVMAKSEAQAEAETLRLQLDAQGRNERFKTQIKRVIEYVPKHVDCDLPPEPVGVLNAARRGALSEPSRGPDAARGSSGG